MPDIYQYDDEQEWMKVCVPKHMEEGKDNGQAVSICASMWADKNDAAKYRLLGGAIKAVGDWELEVLAVPFNRPDSDGQTFDASTDFMLETFSAPAILYHHGVNPGKKTLQGSLAVIGKAVKTEVKSDGVYVRVLLDKTVEFARRVWEAAKRGLAVASSDSIAHLARLEVNGKRTMYEKNKAGRVAVWPLAGLSLWDKVEGNFTPASQYAIALPAMKAIYREAGLDFPEIKSDDVLPEAKNAVKQSKIDRTNKESQKLLKYFKEY